VLTHVLLFSTQISILHYYTLSARKIGWYTFISKNKIDENEIFTANISRQTTMSNNIAPHLLTLPIELIFRILDNLDDFTILCSVRNVCTRLNTITNVYHRYQVSLKLIIHYVWNMSILDN